MNVAATAIRPDRKDQPAGHDPGMLARRAGNGQDVVERHRKIGDEDLPHRLGRGSCVDSTATSASPTVGRRLRRLVLGVRSRRSRGKASSRPREGGGRRRKVSRRRRGTYAARSDRTTRITTARRCRRRSPSNGSRPVRRPRPSRRRWRCRRTAATLMKTTWMPAQISDENSMRLAPDPVCPLPQTSAAIKFIVSRRSSPERPGRTAKASMIKGRQAIVPSPRKASVSPK